MYTDLIIVLSQPYVQTRLGQPANLSVMLRNQSSLSRNFRLEVLKIDPNWVSPQTMLISVELGKEATPLNLTFNPPLYIAEATYPVLIKVSSIDIEGQSWEVPLDLKIVPTKSPVDLSDLFDGDFPSVLPFEPNKPADTTGLTSRATTSRIKVKLLSVDTAGQSTATQSWQLEVSNVDIIDQRLTDYSVCVVGLPAGWARVEPPYQTLRYSESKVLHLILQPGSQVRAGKYKFQARVYSHLNPQEWVQIPCTLEVKANSPTLPPIWRTSREIAKLEAAQASLAVGRGGRTRLNLSLYNRSQEHLTFILKSSGLPQRWYSLAPTELAVNPGEVTHFELELHPSSDSLPGSYPFWIEAWESQSQARQDREAILKVGVSLEIVESQTLEPSRLQITAVPGAATLPPGQETTFELGLVNHSARYDVFHLEAKAVGLPAEYIEIEQPFPQSLPFGKLSSRLKVKLPGDPVRSLPGDYTIQVTAFSEIEEAKKTVTTLQLKIPQTPLTGDYSFRLLSEEQRGIRRAEYRVEVSNQANATLEFKPGITKAAPGLSFEFKPARWEIPPGQKAQISLEVRADQIVSQEKRWEFEIKGEGNYNLTQKGGPELRAKAITATFIQLAAPALLVRLDPSENTTEQSTYYTLTLRTTGAEPLKVRLNFFSSNGQLKHHFEPDGSFIVSAAEEKLKLSVYHPKPAHSKRSVVYNFKVVAQDAEDDKPVVRSGQAEGRFIHRRSEKPWPTRLVATGIALLTGVMLVAGIALTKPSFLFPTPGPVPTTGLATRTPGPSILITPSLPTTSAGTISQVTSAPTIPPTPSVALPTTARPTTLEPLTAGPPPAVPATVPATTRAPLTTVPPTTGVPTTSLITPTTSPPPVPAVKFDFIQNAPAASWCSSDSSQPVSCTQLSYNLGGANQEGFVVPRNNTPLEDSSTPTTTILETVPKPVVNGVISGTYSTYTVAPGDHFKATVGFLRYSNQTQVRVEVLALIMPNVAPLPPDFFKTPTPTHSLPFITPAVVPAVKNSVSAIQLISKELTYDGKLANLDVDLSKISQPGNPVPSNLSGANVQFQLAVTSLKASASGDWFVWINPRIEGP